jgi:hypothetical protein
VSNNPALAAVLNFALSSLFCASLPAGAGIDG